MASDPLPHDGRNAKTQERSLGELFSELTAETRTLVRQELQLAKTELSQKAKTVAKDAGMIGAGGIVAYIGVFFVLAAVAIGVGHYIGYGWASLIVGVVLIGIGAVMAMSAKKELQRTSLAPERTEANVKETKQWMKEQTH